MKVIKIIHEYANTLKQSKLIYIYSPAQLITFRGFLTLVKGAAP